MNQITILNQANVPMGPFTREQVADKLQKGEVALSSLAFVEGLTEWTPLRDVLARVDAAAPPARPIVAAPHAAAPTAASAPAPAYSYAATMQPPPHLVYAGFWLRLAALLIDSVILTAATFLILIPWALILETVVGPQNLGFHPPSSGQEPSSGTYVILGIMELLLFIVLTLGQWFYFAYFEASSWQGTVGKRVLNLRVTDLAGERISLWRATGRFFGKGISGLILDIGYIMAAFTERKQALHDMLAGTLVVRN